MFNKKGGLDEATIQTNYLKEQLISMRERRNHLLSIRDQKQSEYDTVKLQVNFGSERYGNVYQDLTRLDDDITRHSREIGQLDAAIHRMEYEIINLSKS
ncbi:hypothetical protein QYM36_018157 [Artemia franciscana]|uniref:Uncharacterized protein n=1 Tax=Artemia franciscana TaxID=6661 RepID=A0AA88H7D8_ARTSF|nr:hypothetical protein QYM36_018157 [Artemia franciscana]